MGGHLVSTNQSEEAINHFMQAHAHSKALAAAINIRQWTKAISLAENLDDSTAQPFYVEIAEHYEKVDNTTKQKNTIVQEI